MKSSITKDRRSDGRSLSLLLVLLFAISGCALFEPAPPPREQRMRAADPLLDSLQAEVRREVNRARLKEGLPMLVDDASIERTAVLYSAELAVRGTIGHRSVTPTRQTAMERLRAERVFFTLAGENLARIDDNVDRVSATVVQAWMNSQSHYRTMMTRDFVRTGVGITRSPDGLWFIVQMFAAPVVPPALIAY